MRRNERTHPRQPQKALGNKQFVGGGNRLQCDDGWAGGIDHVLVGFEKTGYSVRLDRVSEVVGVVVVVVDLEDVELYSRYLTLALQFGYKHQQ